MGWRDPDISLVPHRGDMDLQKANERCVASGTESRRKGSSVAKGAFYASLKIIGKLAEALWVEPAELLKR